MKRTIVAVAVGATAFGSIYGLAASLGVSSDTLGSGSAAVAACQATTDVVNVAYTPSYTTASYKTTTVTLTGLLSSCYNKTAFVTVTGTNSLASAPVSVSGSSGATGTASFTVAAVAADVTGVSVAISG
jgi:hypothetical protein